MQKITFNKTPPVFEETVDVDTKLIKDKTITEKTLCGVTIQCSKLEGCKLINCCVYSSLLVNCTASNSHFIGSETAYCDISDSVLDNTYNAESAFKGNLTVYSSLFTGGKISCLLKSFSCSSLINVNTSGTQIVGYNSSQYLRDNFEFTPEGMVCYKAIGYTEYVQPNNWKIEEGEYLTEFVNNNIFDDCGNGVNVGTLKYINEAYGLKVGRNYWRCTIEYPDMCEVCVPVWSAGKIRAGRVRLDYQVDANGERFYPKKVKVIQSLAGCFYVMNTIGYFLNNHFEMGYAFKRKSFSSEKEAVEVANLHGFEVDVTLNVEHLYI